MHYIDEGSGDPILFLHGNPTSCYLWRNIVPHLSTLGRCIALDLIGMGQSDKPDIEYRFFEHVQYVEGFIEKMKLESLTLVIHDWGSALGFHYAMRHENNVQGLAFMEAFLGPLDWDRFPPPKDELFRKFRTPDVGWDLIVNQNFFVEKMLPGSVVRKLTNEELQHYREPYPTLESRKPIWRWPNELPIVAWSRKHLKNLRVVNVGPGIHYIQEDNPHRIGQELANWYSGLGQEGPSM